MRRHLGHNFWIVLLALCIMLFATSCRTAPIYNVNNAPVPTGLEAGKNLTIQEVHNAIVEGGAKRGWKMQTVNEGHLVAKLNVRSHEAEVDINYSVNNYSIVYKGSVNLKEANGKISSSYVTWIHNLERDINKSLSDALVSK